MTLDFFTVDFEWDMHRPIPSDPLLVPNLIRGELGRRLHGSDLYTQLFAPPRRNEGPSGLADPPRPFVVRPGLSEGRTLRFAIHVFDSSLTSYFNCNNLILNHLSLTPTLASVSRLQLRFLSPTFLRNEAKADFSPLFRRLRDRISSLRALYGSGPLEIDFRDLSERSQRIHLVSSDLQPARVSRFSRSTGQTHPVGGFTGNAVYEGDLSPFLPYLKAAFYTGVGKHTTWGNGQIEVVY